MQTLTGPLDLLTCLDTVSGSVLWTMVYFAVLILGVVGWAQTWGLTRGMLLGGFFANFFGLVLFVLQLISLGTLFWSVIIWLIGLIMIVIEINRD